MFHLQIVNTFHFNLKIYCEYIIIRIKSIGETDNLFNKYKLIMKICTLTQNGGFQNLRKNISLQFTTKKLQISLHKITKYKVF